GRAARLGRTACKPVVGGVADYHRSGLHLSVPPWETSMTFGMIVGNRGFFPDHLAKTGREEMLGVLGKAGHQVIAPSPEDTKYGAVETREEAKKCAALFRANRERIQGVIVTLPNFGDEKAIAETLRMAGLN